MWCGHTTKEKKLNIHADYIEDEEGNLIDVDWYCSAFCFNEAMQDQEKDKDSYGHAYPCGVETEEDVYCDNCKDLLWSGYKVTVSPQ